MILSDIKIREAIKEYGLISNYEESQINPASINLRLGNSWLVPQQCDSPIKLGQRIPYTEFTCNEFVINPGRFILATTMEYVKLPKTLSAFVDGRSSIGRAGLTVENAGFVDPGFHGHITLELINDSPYPIVLTAGYPVTQLVFVDTYPVELPYHGKYNGQVKATGSRMYMD